MNGGRPCWVVSPNRSVQRGAFFYFLLPVGSALALLPVDGVPPTAVVLGSFRLGNHPKFVPPLLVRIVTGGHCDHFLLLGGDEFRLLLELFVHIRDFAFQTLRWRLVAERGDAGRNFLLPLGERRDIRLGGLHLPLDRAQRAFLREVDFAFGGIGLQQRAVLALGLFAGFRGQPRTLFLRLARAALLRRQCGVGLLDLNALLVELDAALVDRLRRNLVGVMDDALVIHPFVRCCASVRRRQDQRREQQACKRAGRERTRNIPARRRARHRNVASKSRFALQ